MGGGGGWGKKGEALNDAISNTFTKVFTHLGNSLSFLLIWVFFFVFLGPSNLVINYLKHELKE